VLLDVNDVALGHTTKMRWNEGDQWIYSEKVVHPALVTDDTFAEVQQMLAGRSGGQHKPHRSKHDYALRGLLVCGLCDRRMQGHWADAAPYHRCSFATEYGLANHVSHPRNVTLRQDAILGPLDKWLSRKFGARHLAGTIDELAAATKLPPAGGDGPDREAAARIADCDRKLDGYRAALDAGGDPVTISRWITETTAERARYTARTRPTAPRAPMTRKQIASVVTALGDILAVLRDADPADKAEIYGQLGLRLTYQPGRRVVRAEAHLDQTAHWVFDSVRGGT
jgi:site-specific DNA recombinase